jgi:hypothetical protein
MQRRPGRSWTFGSFARAARWGALKHSLHITRRPSAPPFCL